MLWAFPFSFYFPFIFPKLSQIMITQEKADYKSPDRVLYKRFKRLYPTSPPPVPLYHLGFNVTSDTLSKSVMSLYTLKEDIIAI